MSTIYTKNTLEGVKTLQDNLKKLPIKKTKFINLGVLEIPKGNKTVFSLRQFRKAKKELSIILESENKDEVIKKFREVSLFI